MQLLQLAGWREGRGLGAAEQGIASPLPAWHNRGRSGIGAPSCAPADARAASSAARAAAEPSQGQQQCGQGQEGAAAAAEGATRGPGRPRRAPKRGWETVAVEEALPAKVARVKQVRTQGASPGLSDASARPSLGWSLCPAIVAPRSVLSQSLPQASCLSSGSVFDSIKASLPPEHGNVTA